MTDPSPLDGSGAITPAAAESERAAPPAAAVGQGLWPPPDARREVLRLVTRIVAALALASALVVGALRWIDPPISSFMTRQAVMAWWNDRPRPYFYHAWVPWERIPAALPLAVIAGEDQRFAYHHGFDPEELRKALAAWRQGGGLRGASTITQQTAKNLFLWSGRSWLRKVLEAWFSALIEALWSKQRILEVYLNIAQFSPSTYGVGATSERYFHRPVEEITPREAALLAAVLPAPSTSRLIRPSARVQRRADWIADQVQRLGGRRYLDLL